ncbi:DUF3494 domain-containing protein [Corallococcus soli]|nr:DUF3494 domain-containing protein [Corallococcus soli]
MAFLPACDGAQAGREGEEFGASKAAIAVAPSLGVAQSFAVLGASTVTNTGPTVITGDLGLSPGTSITGFPPGVVIGTIHATDALAAQAQSDTTAAYNNLAGQPCDVTLPSAELGGLTLAPGVYCFSSASASLTGTLTLNAGGNPDAVWVFKTASTLITASSSSVLLINGGQPCNVFWQVGSSATLGTNSDFVGNILALTSITLTTGVELNGRALARNGAVTLDSNTVTVNACAGPVTPLPPTLSKDFSPATISAGGTSILTITLINPNPTVAALTAPLTDTLPAGVTTVGMGSTTCVGGVVMAGPTTMTLMGGTIPASGSCTVTVQVTAPAGGSYFNSLAAGALVTSNGSNQAPAVATLTVATPSAVTLGKAFTPSSITAGGASTLTITLTNSNAAPAVLTAPLVDTLPPGVTPAGMGSTTCVGGSVMDSLTTVTLTGGYIPANGSCTVTVPVTAPVAGTFINTLPAGALRTNRGNNAAPAIATLVVIPVGVVVPPTVCKDFSPSTIKAGGVSNVTITLFNANATPALLMAPLVDTLPAGVATVGMGSTTCLGGIVSTTASTVTLMGGYIPANSSCTVTVPVTAHVAGSFVNTLPAGALRTNKGNNAAPAVATLVVTSKGDVVAPKVHKSFTPSTIGAGGTSALTIILTNPNNTPAVLTAPLVDTLPAGVTTLPGPATNTCGGVVTTTPYMVTLTGGTIPANGSCTVTVCVTSKKEGSYSNVIPKGALQTDKGSNQAPATAVLTVKQGTQVSPNVTKDFHPSSIRLGKASLLTITLSNPHNSVAYLNSSLADFFPDGMMATGGASTTCGGELLSYQGSTGVEMWGGSIPANGSCTVQVEVTTNCKGQFHNQIPVGALETNLGSNTQPADATLSVY